MGDFSRLVAQSAPPSRILPPFGVFVFAQEHEETKRSLEKQKEETEEVKKESHKRKKMLIAQQQMLTAGTNSYHKVRTQLSAVMKTSTPGTNQQQMGCQPTGIVFICSAPLQWPK